jgi:hypothetical protein
MLMLELEVVSMLVLALVLTRRGVVERWGSMSSLQAVGLGTLGLWRSAPERWDSGGRNANMDVAWSSNDRAR